jgi:hypothetical protein
MDGAACKGFADRLHHQKIGGSGEHEASGAALALAIHSAFAGNQQVSDALEFIDDQGGTRSTTALGSASAWERRPKLSSVR